MNQLNYKRTHNLGIWALGLGYYLFYTPYSGLTKGASTGLFSAFGRPVPGIVLLPAAALATAACMLGFITLMKWWKYAGHRNFFGLSIPFPRLVTFMSGVCMATIIGTTTLAFAFGGISIVLVLVLLRGGVLVLAPLVDRICGRRVRWFSWAAMWISLMAVLVVLSDAANYKLSFAAVVDVGAYLAAYFFKFQFMTKLAKSNEQHSTLRYFVEEQMIASPLLVLALGVMAAIGTGEVMGGFRLGFTTFLLSRDVVLALGVGLFYAGLCICTTFIFLDRRENTFCVPMHCGSSMLSGLTASYALAIFFKQATPSTPQLISAGLIIVALGFLSPLHHFELYLGKLRSLFHPGRVKDSSSAAGLGQLAPAPLLTTPTSASFAGNVAADEDLSEALRRIILFVCSGNTCRSPMAAAIGNAEIATRLRLPAALLDPERLPALSAGISARAGAPMTPEAQQALRLIGVPVPAHSARNLNAELAQRVERIFCMTRAHQKAVIDLVPAAAAKTQCLDPDGDVEDPIGAELGVYVKCAQRLESLIKLRFDEIGLQGGLAN